MVEKPVPEKWGEGVQLPEREEREERAESGGKHVLQGAGWDARKEGFCKGVKVGEGKGHLGRLGRQGVFRGDRRGPRTGGRKRRERRWVWMVFTESERDRRG